jgi:glycosyltransferase involved in cell wall biosynthesis
MRKSHLFLFPSAEGAGMVVLEAMACGLPVVCLDIGGPGQMVGPGCGVKIPVDSASDMTGQLANAMGDILGNPEQRESMSNRARGWVQAKYAWQSKKGVLRVAYSRTYREHGPGNIDE